MPLAAVYMYQKLLIFIDAFSCYKQKWKLAPFIIWPTLYVYAYIH